jgi:predicted regulator of amino acid metabolism with ACT domain
MALEDELADEVEDVMVVDEIEVDRVALAELVVVDRSVVGFVVWQISFSTDNSLFADDSTS